MLVDGYSPINDPGISDDAHPRISIEDETQLRAELVRLAKMRPRMVFLNNESTTLYLRIGIGGPFASIRCCKQDGENGLAVANIVRADAPIEFQIEGSQAGFWPKNLLPIEEAIDIVVHFFQTEQLAEWIKWE
jgi:hypothetical protein